MAELDRILGEAEEAHRGITKAVKTADDGTVRDVVRLRTRLATLIAEMMGAIKADSRLQAKTELAREFDAKFFEMRQALGQHQGKWRSADIQEDPVGYGHSTEELGRKLDDFFAWTRGALAGL